MIFQTVIASGAIILAVVIGLTTFLKWPTWLNYIWAALALIWGIAVFVT